MIPFGLPQTMGFRTGQPNDFIFSSESVTNAYIWDVLRFPLTFAITNYIFQNNSKENIFFTYLATGQIGLIRVLLFG